MTRTEKITKLSGAIRGYRGSFNPQTGKWIKPPSRNHGLRVITWLERLKLDLKTSMEAINGFTKLSEMDAWLRAL